MPSIITVEPRIWSIHGARRNHWKTKEITGIKSKVQNICINYFLLRENDVYVIYIQFRISVSQSIGLQCNIQTLLRNHLYYITTIILFTSFIWTNQDNKILVINFILIRREWRNEWEFNLFYKKIICVMTCVKIVLSTICIKNKYPFFVLFVQGYFDNLHDICGIIFCDIKHVRSRQIRHLSLFEFSNCWFTH